MLLHPCQRCLKSAYSQRQRAKRTRLIPQWVDKLDGARETVIRPPVIFLREGRPGASGDNGEASCEPWARPIDFRTSDERAGGECGSCERKLGVAQVEHQPGDHHGTKAVQ